MLKRMILLAALAGAAYWQSDKLQAFQAPEFRGYAKAPVQFIYQGRPIQLTFVSQHTLAAGCPVDTVFAQLQQWCQSNNCQAGTYTCVSDIQPQYTQMLAAQEHGNTYLWLQDHHQKAALKAWGLAPDESKELCLQLQRQFADFQSKHKLPEFELSCV